MSSRRASRPVIHRDSSGGRVNRPSRDMPHFAITNGCPVTIHLLNASLSRVHSSAKIPFRTRTPAFRNSTIPLPECRGFRSVAPMTTLFKSSFDYRIGAWRSAPGCRTRLQSYVERSMRGNRCAEIAQAFNLSMCAPGFPMMSFRHYPIIDHHDGPYCGIGLLRPSAFFASTRAARMNSSSRLVVMVQAN